MPAEYHTDLKPSPLKIRLLDLNLRGAGSEEDPDGTLLHLTFQGLAGTKSSKSRFTIETNSLLVGWRRVTWLRAPSTKPLPL